MEPIYLIFRLVYMFSFQQDAPDAKPLGRGTRIELVLKEDMAEFLEERKVCFLLSKVLFSHMPRSISDV